MNTAVVEPPLYPARISTTVPSAYTITFFEIVASLQPGSLLINVIWYCVPPLAANNSSTRYPATNWSLVKSGTVGIGEIGGTAVEAMFTSKGPTAFVDNVNLNIMDAILFFYYKYLS